jgi:hypothetical protein
MLRVLQDAFDLFLGQDHSHQRQPSPQLISLLALSRFLAARSLSILAPARRLSDVNSLSSPNRRRAPLERATTKGAY